MARFLIVDDSPTSRRLLINVLRRASTDAAGDPDIVEVDAEEAALAALDGAAFDAVFVDMMLGGQRSGLDVLRSIVAREPAARVVVATALSREHPDVVTALSLGAFDHLQKPVAVATVREVVRRIEADAHGDRGSAGRIPRWATGPPRTRV